MEIKIRAIRTKEQYQEYLSKVDHLMEMDPEPNSQAGELLETLAILIEDYESRLGYDIPAVNDPIIIIRKRI